MSARRRAFYLTAENDLGVLTRILSAFIVVGASVDFLEARLNGSGDITLHVSNLDERQASLVAARLRNIIGVGQVGHGWVVVHAVG